MCSVALYRHGDLGRVRLQRRNSTALINGRAEPAYHQVPAGPAEAVVAYETGCASPIAQAPPVAVASIAATATRHAIEVLTDRADVDHDIVEVYHPLDEAPFKRAPGPGNGTISSLSAPQASMS